MLAKITDKDWEAYGAHDPYFGVLSAERYKSSRLTDEAKNEFFQTGEDHVRSVIDKVRVHLDPAFSPARSLDFGCGVGRLVLPLAGVSGTVTGVDVSPSMLALAKSNCERRGVDNVSFVRSDDALSGLSGVYDFIHSYIVFQHIPPRRGMNLFQQLLNRLDNGGVGVMHFTYAHTKFRTRLLLFLRSRIPLARGLLNWVRGRKFSAPEMQMNIYNLNRLLRLIRDAGAESAFLEQTDHGGYLGVVLYFKRQTARSGDERLP